MKVIGAGLPRTATLSQKIALEMLGVAPCYHMVNVLAELDQAARWRSAVFGECSPGEILDPFEGTVDWPGSFFYRELAEIYPDAKVVLSTRDPESWARSMRETIWGLFYDDILIRHLSAARSVVDAPWRGYMELMESMWERSGLIEGPSTSLEYMAASFERYCDEVKATIPSERLLVWTASDGWEPLCEFLGVGVPDTPFPRVNDGKMFAERIIDGALLAIEQYRSQQADAPAVIA